LERTRDNSGVVNVGFAVSHAPTGRTKYTDYLEGQTCTLAHPLLAGKLNGSRHMHDA